MDICDKNECVGCGVCKNVCNINAISFHYDSEGFLFPYIDSSKCVNCGLCKKKCTALNIENEKNRFYGAYAYFTNNEELRKKSSSGGVFSDIARFFITEKKGVVIGAAYEANHYVIHKVAENIKDLDIFIGSKYSQSDTIDIFPIIKNYLDNDRPVLFSGTPCQVAAVNTYIGANDNLFTVDLFCHGVPSPVLFSKYIQEMGIKENSFITFKDKANGWNDSCIKYDTENGPYYARHSQDTVYLGFVENLYLRQSCYTCSYNRIYERPADISIGDFWDIEKNMPDIAAVKDDIGVSAVLCNSEKGKLLFNVIKENAGFCKEVEISAVVEGNSCLTESVVSHPKRQFFYNDLEKTEKFLVSARKFLKIGNDVLLLNHSFSHDNYGAMMVAFSMEKIVKRLGYKPTSLLFEWNHTPIFDKFKQDFLHCTDPYYQNDYSKLKKLNKKYGTFITGSDQVWRNWNKNETLYRWFVDFADNKKNIFSYAASFGFDYFDETGVSSKKISKLLNSFSGISVREQSGVDIVKNYFGFNAEWVIDPTQLLEAEDYEEIIEKEHACPPCEEPYLAYMIFPGDDNETDKTYDFIENIAKNLNLKAVPLLANKGSNQKKVGEWLATIKNASFVITESFHGTMFSLIFKRPMIILALDETERNRLPSLFDKLGCLQNRILYSLDNNLGEKIAEEKIDWDFVYAQRKKFQNYSMDYLRTSLSKEIYDNGKKTFFSIKMFFSELKRGLSKIMPTSLKNKLRPLYYKYIK